MYIDEQVKGVIYFVDGDSYSFDSDDIIDDNVSILQQATADNSFMVGGTYASTLNMTIRIPKGKTNSYDIIGSKISLYSKYGSETEFILRGIFWVTSASRYEEIYTLSCSDAITWLDSTQYADYGDTYNNLIYEKLVDERMTLNGKLGEIVDATNEVLATHGIDSIQKYENSILNDFPTSADGLNHGWYCVLPKDATGESGNHCPRDYAGWLSQIACGFLECKYFENDEIPYISIGQFETSPTDSIYCENFENDSFEIANFEINCCKVYAEIYNGEVRATNTKNQNLNSIVVDISGNAFVDGHYDYKPPLGGDDCLDILEIMLEFLQKLHIRPFSCTYHAEKRFKLGQCIKIIDEDNVEHITILTKIQWNFKGGYELKCAGEDTRVLFDSARRTPSKKAKEEAITKLNYVIQETARGLQSNIDYIDSKFETKLQDADGKTQDLDYWVNCLWNSMYAENDTVDSLRKRIEALEGKVNATS